MFLLYPIFFAENFVSLSGESENECCRCLLRQLSKVDRNRAR